MIVRLPENSFQLGPGCVTGDWLCNLYVYRPQPEAVAFQQTNVEDAAGRTVTNPLFVVYGCFDIL
jgi:hypothetical protein